MEEISLDLASLDPEKHTAFLSNDAENLWRLSIMYSNYDHVAFARAIFLFVL